MSRPSRLSAGFQRIFSRLMSRHCGDFVRFRSDLAGGHSSGSFSTEGSRRPSGAVAARSKEDLSMTKSSHVPVLAAVLVLVFAGLAPACAELQMQPPARVTTTTAPAGVAVAVVGQRCSQNVDPDWPEADLVQATLETQVRNTTAQPVTVHRNGFRLVAPDGQAIPTASWGANEPITVAAGQAESFKLRFSDRGGLSCSKDMRLDGPTAVTEGAQVVQVASVSFRPSLL
jgi:hypothetical protein